MICLPKLIRAINQQLIPNQLINDTDALIPDEPPPGPQYWGSMKQFKAPRIGGLGA
jgi:hypothetical protein